MGNTDEIAKMTSDVVLFSTDENDIEYVLVILRGHDPFAGCWALPGGHVDKGEDTADAAIRELEEEAGLLVTDLRFVGVYAAPGRDPRGRYVDFVYTAHVPGLPEPTGADDAVEARWFPVDVLLADEQLAFDHAKILHDAVHLKVSTL